MFASHVWTSLIRQKELAKDQGEWNLCLSPSLFFHSLSLSHPHSLPGFHSPFLARLPLLFAALSCSQVLLVIRLSLCSSAVFLSFTLDLSSPFPVLPYRLILPTSHYSHQFSTSLFLLSHWKWDFSLSKVETPHHLPTLNSFFSFSLAFFFHSSLAVRLSAWEDKHWEVGPCEESGGLGGGGSWLGNEGIKQAGKNTIWFLFC